MKKEKVLSSISVILALTVFLLCACSEEVTPLNRDQADKLVTEITATSDIFSEEMVQLGENSVSNIFSFLDDSPWKICYAGISGVTADELLVAEAPSEEKLNEYYSKIESYIENRISQFSGYAPEEVPKLESALLIKDGMYIIYIACADTNKAQQVIDGIKDK